MTGISIKKVQKFISKRRDKTVQYFEVNKISSGGPGVIVKIDGFMLNYKTKVQ